MRRKHSSTLRNWDRVLPSTRRVILLRCARAGPQVQHHDGGHSGRQVAILAKSLGQNRSQGCVRIHHQNPLGLTSGLGWGQAG